MMVNNERSLQLLDQPKLAIIKSIDLKLIAAPDEREMQRPKRKRRNRKETKDNPFQNWCMPDQGSRYIKPNTYDFF